MNVSLNANNANLYIGKLVKAIAVVRGYTHLNTSVTPPSTAFQVGTEIGVLQKVEQVGSDYWGLIKLKYPVKLTGKVLGVSSTKTYSDLYVPIKFLSVDDALPIPSNAALSRDVWCTANNVFLRKAPQASGDYINTFVKGNYLGKTDAIARTGGSYSGGNTWYTIQIPDGRIGYMATSFCSLTKPTAPVKTTTPAGSKPAQEEFTVPASEPDKTRQYLLIGLAVAVGGFVLYRLFGGRKSSK